MRWRDMRQSTNVEDRRGRGGGLAVGGGLGGIVIALLAYFLGIDPGTVDQTPQTSPRADANGQVAAANDSMRQFVGAVLGSTEDVWTQLFQREGKQYSPPRLVMFSDQVQSACGFTSAAVGPFYCPNDQRVYIDIAFYRELRDRLGAPGDFAQAYVIAHEVGHHVQNLLGISDQAQRAQQNARSQAEANDISVRLELQADFFAGVWAHYAEQQGALERGDIEEALNAASAIGDDRLQRESQGYIVPDSFTHGTSEQRMQWFKKGLETGDMNAGDTFSQGAI